jgi:hypothetical protein
MSKKINFSIKLVIKKQKKPFILLVFFYKINNKKAEKNLEDSSQKGDDPVGVPEMLEIDRRAGQWPEMAMEVRNLRGHRLVGIVGQVSARGGHLLATSKMTAERLR